MGYGPQGSELPDHNTRHQDGGGDEISIAALSGLLADDQHVLDAEVLAVAAALVHASRHAIGGADPLRWTNAKLLLGAGAGADPTEVDVPATGGVAIFGDGSDGAVDINTGAFSSGPITSNALTRDAFFTNLTLSGGDLDCAGYRLFCSGTLTINSGYKVHRNGNDGANGTGAGGGAAGAALAAANLGGSGAGGAGGDGSGAGAAGGAATPALGASAGAGGNGAAGAGGAAGAATATTQGIRAIPVVITAHEPGGTQIKGGGGGGGGGSDTLTADAGGGGGSGGGIVVIAAKTLVNNGTIQANGGTGGDANSSNNPGGGGGGGGGALLLIYNSLTTGTEEAAAGAGGAGYGTGAAGTAGTAGVVIKLANA